MIWTALSRAVLSVVMVFCALSICSAVAQNRDSINRAINGSPLSIDPQAAFDDAGYDDEQPLELTMHYATSDEDRRLFIAAAAMWRDAPIRVRLINVEPRAIQDLYRRREFQLIRTGWVADYAHPIISLNCL